MSTIEFKISVPTDEGFLGRECNSPDCMKYFRVHTGSIRDTMNCPYCGQRFSNDELHTQDQADFLRDAGKEKAIQYAQDEINKMLGGLAKKFKGNKHISFTHKPSRSPAKVVKPIYQEHKVDTELKCPDCDFVFQVFGIFGFCPGCRSENMQVYDANIGIIKQEISEATDKGRVLRHAYSDLVSTFEQFCISKAAPINEPKPSFQDLFEARRFFKKNLGVDILEDLSTSDSLCARRVFQKRHAYQHSAGKINEKYIKKVPEDKSLLGEKAELSESEFLEGARVIREITSKIAGGRVR